MSHSKQNQKAAWLFCTFGSTAIVAGGVFAAFSAAEPTRLALWLSAYLVLVVGVIQAVIGAGVAALSVKKIPYHQHLTTFLLLNAGNAAVMTGTVVKGAARHNTLLVDAGSGAVVIALILCLYFVRGANKSWWRVGYVASITLTLVGALTGVILVHIL